MKKNFVEVEVSVRYGTFIGELLIDDFVFTLPYADENGSFSLDDLESSIQRKLAMPIDYIITKCTDCQTDKTWFTAPYSFKDNIVRHFKSWWE